MINKIVLATIGFALLLGCAKSDTSEVLAEAGNRKLTRNEFRSWAGEEYESLSAEERFAELSEWVEMAMIEQEIDAGKLRTNPEYARQERRIVDQYYRAILLSRQGNPEITDSLIADYFNGHREEFKRPSDSYLIESFWCESEDSLKAFRRALSKADTANLRSGFVIWEGKWLASANELDAPLLYGVRSTEPGGLTQVLPFGEGYRLVRLHEVYPQGSQLSLDAVRGEIRERLLTEQSQRRQERWENDLRSRYQPKIMGESK